MTNNSTEEHINYNGLDYILLFRLIVWGYLGIILSIFGIIGNVITIIVLISPSMRTTSTNIYLTALSCSNILFLLIFIPSYSVRYLIGYKFYMSNYPPFTFEIILTRLPTTPVYNTILLSIIYLTIALSMDRLILIKFPLKAKHILRKRTTLITIGLIYLFSIVYCIPYWLERRYIPELNECHLTKIGIKIHKYTRIYIYIPVVYLIPFVTLTCINITIIQYLIMKKRHKQHLIGRISTRRKTADYHITLMLVLVIILFVFSQLPLLILNVWYAIDPHGSYESLRFHALNIIGVLSIVFNTSTNFLLYCFFGEKFRHILISFILNIFSKYTHKTQQKPIDRICLEVPKRSVQQRLLSTSSSTTTYDSKLNKNKLNDYDDQSVVEPLTPVHQLFKEEARLLVPYTLIQIQDHNSHIYSKRHSLDERNQLLVLKNC